MLLLVLFVSLGLACRPQCVEVCDVPVCNADCVPLCKPPVCTAVCNNTSCARQPLCSVSCTKDSCASDSCPQCETRCGPLVGCDSSCNVYCEAPECGWTCFKPQSCPPRTCEIQCEHPACEITVNNSQYRFTATSAASIFTVTLLVALVLLFE